MDTENVPVGFDTAASCAQNHIAAGMAGDPVRDIIDFRPLDHPGAFRVFVVGRYFAQSQGPLGAIHQTVSLGVLVPVIFLLRWRFGV